MWRSGINIGYPAFAVVGELGSDDAMEPWFLLFMFLPLPLDIWSSLVLADLAVSDCYLSLLQACVSVFLKDQFSLRSNLDMENCGSGSALGCKLSPTVLWFLCPDGSGQVPLGPGI